MTDPSDWLLTASERGNPDSDVPAWGDGNHAEALIDGATYFDRLVTEVEALGPGDHLFFADWRGDADQRLRDDGPTVAELFRAAAERGVVVKGLMWRSHPTSSSSTRSRTAISARAIERAGGEVLLDQRVRIGGSHHQRLVVIRHPGQPHRDVAFSGGIDLCHSAAMTGRIVVIRRRCACRAVTASTRHGMTCNFRCGAGGRGAGHDISGNAGQRGRR